MKYIDAFRDNQTAQSLSKRIAEEVQPDRHYRYMEFCGGHTHALARYGLQTLLPSNIEMIHGPGCPVCVLPIARMDQAIQMALDYPVILCTYGDCLRVPASGQRSLFKARAQGADIRMIYSPLDALHIARSSPHANVVFFAIGFETSTPATASALLQAQSEKLDNFFILCNHVLTLPAMQAILDAPDAPQLDGLVGPSHVSTILGSSAFNPVAERFQKPVVIAGFEPLDLLLAIRMLIQQTHAGEAHVENEFTRGVTPAGNQKAQSLVNEVFITRPQFEWRGLGWLPVSGLMIRARYANHDAELRFPVPPCPSQPDHKACECPAILRGQKKPMDCKLFDVLCTPENPIGACMVSSEGACAAHYTYGRFNDR